MAEGGRRGAETLNTTTSPEWRRQRARAGAAAANSPSALVRRLLRAWVTMDPAKRAGIWSGLGAIRRERELWERVQAMPLGRERQQAKAAYDEHLDAMARTWARR
jgi:hypothetical protein